MSAIKTILLIEDNPGDARLVIEALREQDPHSSVLVHVGSMREAEQYLAAHPVDIILLDQGLPDAQGLAAVRQIHAAAPDVTLVVLTHIDDEELATTAMQEGAQDYLVKGQIETRGLLRALRYSVERKRLDLLKGEFVSTVSHELRTPLTSIAASLGLLAGQADKLPEWAARLASIAHTNCQRLVRLVNDILDIEKLGSLEFVFKMKRVSLRPLIEAAIEASRGFSESHKMRIRMQSDCEEADVFVDADRLAQVVTNLLSNAVKFSAGSKDVMVGIEKRGKTARISVRDYGPGVPIEFRPRIFDKFAQAEATDARQESGTGLGLSIVKVIVRRLGGEVGFVDAVSGGTIFQVDLPLWVNVPDR